MLRERHREREKGKRRELVTLQQLEKHIHHNKEKTYFMINESLSEEKKPELFTFGRRTRLKKRTTDASFSTAVSWGKWVEMTWRGEAKERKNSDRDIKRERERESEREEERKRASEREEERKRARVRSDIHHDLTIQMMKYSQRGSHREPETVQWQWRGCSEPLRVRERDSEGGNYTSRRRSVRRYSSTEGEVGAQVHCSKQIQACRWGKKAHPNTRQFEGV